MKKLFLPAGILLVSLSAGAQSLHRIQQPLQPHFQQMRSRMPSFTSPATAQKGAGTQKERVKSIFVNFGGGDDSVVLYYGSPVRGSRYNYVMFDQLFGYDAGYFYLQNPREWMKYDSLIYITRNDHVSPYMPYRKGYLQYPADSSSLENYARTDVPDAMGNYTTQGTAYRFDRLFATDGSLLHEYDFQYDAGIGQYDTTSVIRNNYYAPGAVLSNENYYFTTPYPNIGGGSRTQNYYTTGGKLYRTDVFTFVPATNSYSTTPATTLYTFNSAGRVASQTSLNGTTSISQDRYTYNVAGQKVTDSLFNAKGSGFNDTANTVFKYTFANATATAYATLLQMTQRLIGGQFKGEPTHMIDSIVNTYDAQDQVTRYQEVYDYDNLGTSPDLDSFNIYITYGAPGRPVYYNAIDVYGGDINYTSTALSYNSANNPLTRTNIFSADFGGTGTIDTFQVLAERYTYEHYNDPTAVAQGIPSKAASLRVFPNPAVTALHLSCTEMKAAQMIITNSTGQIVRSHSVMLGADEAVLPVSDLAPGIYFIMLRDVADGRQATAKFVKE